MKWLSQKFVAKVLIGIFLLKVSGILELGRRISVHLLSYLESDNSSHYSKWKPKMFSIREHNSSSKWFRDRYISTTDLFWTVQNQKLPDDVLGWWLKLQPRPKPPDPYHILDMFYKAGLLYYNTVTNTTNESVTCAVVGNSGNLIESHYGKVIDKHKLVIRFNTAKIKGYEEDVGKRTTHHIAYPESVVQLAPDTSLIFVAFKPADLQWLLTNIKSKDLPKKFNTSLINILHPSFMRYVHKVWLDEHGIQPSAGILGVILSLHVCDTVDVYGFGADKNGGWNHYFENLTAAEAVSFKKLGTHNSDNERDILATLKAEGVIKIHKGSAH